MKFTLSFCKAGETNPTKVAIDTKFEAKPTFKHKGQLIQAIIHVVTGKNKDSIELIIGPAKVWAKGAITYDFEHSQGKFKQSGPRQFFLTGRFAPGIYKVELLPAA